jgi:peroxisomal membrane protein 2
MQAITAGVLSALSDIVSQKLSGIQKLQIKRILLKVVQASFFLITFNCFPMKLIEPYEFYTIQFIFPF